jgi:hypothetical protein
MKYKRKSIKRKSNKRKHKSRRLYIGGAKSKMVQFQDVIVPTYIKDNNLRDKLNNIRLKIISCLLTSGNLDYILLQTLPNYTTDSPYKRQLSMIIILIGLMSFEIQEFCFIYVKGGIATQFALHISGCETQYNTRDIDLFIEPTRQSKYNPKACGELIAMFIFDVANAVTQITSGSFLNPRVRTSNPEEQTDVIKFAYKPINSAIVPLLDISYVAQPVQSLTTFTPIFYRDLPIPMVFYVPTIDCLIAEKLRYMYVYKDDTTVFYNQSLRRSLRMLVECIKIDTSRLNQLIDLAIYSLHLPEDEDDEDAKKYMVEQLKELHR